MHKHMSTWIVLGAAVLWVASAAATTPRFVIGGLESFPTVVDQQTDLEWATGDSIAATTWVLALSHCDQLIFDSHEDWRLPNITELTSIVEENKGTAPAVNATFFSSSAFTIGPFWSSTTNPKSASMNTAYVVWFNDTGNEYARGGVSNVMKTSARNVLCVRTAE
jgi:hypothetical protein